jgi:hypothetical protein
MDTPFSQYPANRPREHAVAVYRYVLDAFPRLGRAPTLAEAERDLGLDAATITDALGELASHDAVRLDPTTGWIADAYPYSPEKTAHEVLLEPGPRVYCMCAIDCFYVPFLTESACSIHSSCHHCGGMIELTVDARHGVTNTTPATVVVWDSGASYDCPKTNFFCDRAHLEAWRSAASEEPGTVRSIEAALERGRSAAARIREVISS